MAIVKQKSNNFSHDVQANDVIDLGQDFLLIWVHGPGGNLEVAPGEAASNSGGASLLWGTITPTANTWSRVTPDFPVRYLRVGTGGEWTVYAINAVGRRLGRN